MRRLMLSLSAALIAGCVSNGYSQFYQAAPGSTPETIAERRAAPPPAEPQLHYAPGYEGLVDAYARKGYRAIGASSFTSGMAESERNAIDQGRSAGADVVVIINPKFERTVSSVVPITTPNTSTSYSSGSATAYGSGGTATAFGNSTTTTYGSSTTYVPVSTDRYEYGAVYFVRMRYVLGINFDYLPDDLRKALQTNRGAYVRVVIEGTPAFFADILPGDVLTSFNGSEIGGPEQLDNLIQSNRGRKVAVILNRDGQIIVKSVELAN